MEETTYYTDSNELREQLQGICRNIKVQDVNTVEPNEDLTVYLFDLSEEEDITHLGFVKQMPHVYRFTDK